MSSIDTSTWSANWAWGLPLIVLNVIIHVVGLAFISEGVVAVLHDFLKDWGFMPRFATVAGCAAMLIAILHGIEGATWAVAYRLLDALPDSKTAMLYSLSAITSYGHANLFLKAHWQMMGALEALNGMLLFGLSTAFLFAITQRVWPSQSRERLRAA
jgi:hypothetical protein